MTRVHTMSSFQHFTTAGHRRGGHTNAGNNNNKNSFRLPSTVTGALASPSNKTKLLFYSEARPDREGRRERAIAGRRSTAEAQSRTGGVRPGAGARARVTHPASRAGRISCRCDTPQKERRGSTDDLSSRSESAKLHSPFAPALFAAIHAYLAIPET